MTYGDTNIFPTCSSRVVWRRKYFFVLLEVIQGLRLSKKHPFHIHIQAGGEEISLRNQVWPTKSVSVPGPLLMDSKGWRGVCGWRIDWNPFPTSEAGFYLVERVYKIVVTLCPIFKKNFTFSHYRRIEGEEYLIVSKLACVRLDWRIHGLTHEAESTKKNPFFL